MINPYCFIKINNNLVDLQSALKISAGTPTLTEYASSVSYASWTKFGRVVVVTIDGLIIPTTINDQGNGYKILKNFPKAINGLHISANYLSETRLIFDEDGNLCTWWSQMKAGNYTFSFAYISKE